MLCGCFVQLRGQACPATVGCGVSCLAGLSEVGVECGFVGVGVDAEELAAAIEWVLDGAAHLAAGDDPLAALQVIVVTALEAALLPRLVGHLILVSLTKARAALMAPEVER